MNNSPFGNSRILEAQNARRRSEILSLLAPMVKELNRVDRILRRENITARLRGNLSKRRADVVKMMTPLHDELTAINRRK